MKVGDLVILNGIYKNRYDKDHIGMVIDSYKCDPYHLLYVVNWYGTDTGPEWYADQLEVVSESWRSSET